MNNAIIAALLFFSVLFLVVALLAISWVLTKLYGKYKVLSDIVNRLDLFLKADGERMSLLNDAIVKLASEAVSSRQSVDQIRDLVTDAANAKSASTVDQYNAAFNELREQGMDEREAHAMASQFILNGKIGEYDD